MDIENKTALVTGGANGIGFSYAKELLRNGAAHVVLLDLKNSNGEIATEKLNNEFGNGKAIFVICDVTKPEELEAGFLKTVEQFGGLDIVINNAGIMDDTRWELMIDINLIAVVRGTMLGLQYMGKDKGGKGGVIVNVSSVLGVTPAPVFPVYCTTKHGVIGLTRSYGDSYYHEKTGVRVLAMLPGMTETNLLVELSEKMSANDAGAHEQLMHAVKTFPSQKADNVAHGMMHVIRSAESGSIWISEGEEPVYEIRIPERKDMKV